MPKKETQGTEKIKENEYKELVDFLGGQFEKIHARLNKVDVVLRNKSDRDDIGDVVTRIMMLGNKIDDYRAEQIGMQKQLNKHEKWHFKTAAKAGLDLLAE